MLVDHSIVEGFASHGAAAVTRRVYAMEETPAAVHLLNRNGAGTPGVTLLSLEAYEMRKAEGMSVEALRERAAGQAVD